MSQWKPYPEIRVWALYLPETGDFVLAIGASFENACEAARSSLDLDEDEVIEMAEEGDAVEMLNAQYGGACICSTGL